MNFFKICLYAALLTLISNLHAQELRGIVRDADQGTPLAGVSISLGKQPISTNWQS